MRGHGGKICQVIAKKLAAAVEGEMVWEGWFEQQIALAGKDVPKATARESLTAVRGSREARANRGSPWWGQGSRLCVKLARDGKKGEVVAELTRGAGPGRSSMAGEIAWGWAPWNFGVGTGGF